MFKRICGWLLALAVVSLPVVADASGGSGGGGGGGGSTTTVVVRVVGYATAIDYTNSKIMIGQLYYGSAALSVNSSTKVTVNNVNATFSDVHLNDYCEVRYDYATRTAIKIAVTR